MHGGMRCRQPASVQVAEREDAALSFSLLKLGCELLCHLLYELLSRQLPFNLIESLGEFLHRVILVLLPRRSPAVMLDELTFVT